MTNTPNRYTLILLRDYANLSQIKVSPFTFWLLVTFFISAFLFCFVAIIISGFIWQNSNAIKLEKDSLYKQLVAAQVRINRLTAVEDIVYKKNINMAKINRRSDSDSEHTNLIIPQVEPRITNSSHITNSQNNNIADVQNNFTTQSSSGHKNEKQVLNNTSIQGNSNNSQEKTITQNEASPEQRPEEKKRNVNKLNKKSPKKELRSRVVALRNVKAVLQSQFITIDMNIVNISNSKQDGTIQYTIVTENAEYKVNPTNKKKNAFYTISRMKDIKTKLLLPKGVTQKMVVGVEIELLNENIPIVRVFESL